MIRAIADLNIFANPLIIKSVRERLRLNNALSWGLVVVVCTVFIYLVCYLGAAEYVHQRSEMAAKWALLAILVVQGVILMLMGTGAVATGIVQERAAGVLDYQRMTPMSPTSKIIGYLFGLPIREYFMFALTMPVAIYAAWQADVSAGKLIHLYAIAMVSVWLYHMTGMVAGMIAPKPWRAGVATQVMVLIMYFVLPLLGRWGFTFFLYLTPRPVFARLAYGELDMELQGVIAPEDWQENVFFYGFPDGIHPTLFTLIVQGFFLTSLFVIVYRKWRDETKHPFTKSYAVLFFAMVQFLLLGSLWPWLTDADKYARVAGDLEQWRMAGLTGAKVGDVVIGVLLGIFFCVSIATAVLLTNMVTPTRHTYAKGLRRAFKLGRGRIALGADAASGLPYAVAYIAFTWISYAMLLKLAIGSERFFTREPTAFAMVLPALMFAGLIIYVQSLRERWGMRGLIMGLFCIWLIPFLLFIVVTMMNNQATKGGYYIASPMPIMSLLYAITYLFDGLMRPELRGDRVLIRHAGQLTIFCTLLHFTLAVLFTHASLQMHRRIRADEASRFEAARAASGADGQHDINHAQPAQHEADHAVDGEEGHVDVMGA